MDLFNELHSRYFYIIEEIINASLQESLTAKDITSIIAELGFAETPLTLTPSLLETGKDSYSLLKETPYGFVPIIKNKPPFVLTELQKRWLKTILYDRRMSLFIDETNRKEYHNLLKDVQPLYLSEHIMPVDMANDGDNYEATCYQALFRTLLSAIQQRKVLLITYESGKGNRLSAYFAPYKLEFALKDDKFRLVAVRMRDKKLRSLYKLNLSRITSAEIFTWKAPSELKSFIQSQRMKTPVEIEITNERNGFERIFTQLSNFERISEYVEETNTCHMKIFYYEVDEMELLITLLSFGPVIRVVGPEHFRNMYIERIENQKKLLYGSPKPIK